MINESNTRIIGDFMEINSDIVAEEFYSKYPKSIAKFISKRKRKKLINMIEKFRKSNYVLTWVNILELLIYFKNNEQLIFEDDNYSAIKDITMESNYLESRIFYNGYDYLLIFTDIDEESCKFNIIAKPIDNNGVGINIYTDKLYTDNDSYKIIMNDINSLLKNLMSDYIICSLTKFI